MSYPCKTMLIGIMLSTCLLAACQQSARGNDASGMTAGESTDDGTDSASQTNKKQGMSHKEQMAAAKVDLAARIGVAQDEVVFWDAVFVEWRSGALGCPMKGMKYTQALVAGFRIVMRVDETEYAYHAKEGSQPFFCPPERIEAPSRSSSPLM